jgi:hypothetical protein
MCVDGIPTIAVFDPGDEEGPAGRCSTSHQPIPHALGIWRFFAPGISHGFLNLGDGDTSLRVVLLDVLPISSVPDDRPIVHAHQYISSGYTSGKGVARGI